MLGRLVGLLLIDDDRLLLAVGNVRLLLSLANEKIGWLVKTTLWWGEIVSHTRRSTQVDWQRGLRRFNVPGVKVVQFVRFDGRLDWLAVCADRLH